MRTPARVLQLAVLVVLAALLGGCGAALRPGEAGPPAAAPALNVGDRWVYHGVEGYRVKIEWDETHEIAAVDPGGITVQVELKGPTVDIQRTERWAAPGVVLEGAVYEAETSHFDPSLVRYKYPLTVGESWNQRIRDTLKPPGPYGPIMRHVSVQGYETVTTPAGTFNALRLSIIMTLDDETFWRWPTQCEYTLWYSPEVGATVRERKRSYYHDKGGMDSAAYHPGQNTEIELISFARR